MTEAEVEQAWRQGRARFEGVVLDMDAFADYVAARAGEGPLHGADLYLACACARGDPAALRIFDRDYLRTVGAMLTRLDPPASIVDEVEQRLRDRLLVRSPDREPAITRYAGRGSLAGWLKVVAMREAMHLLEKQSRHGELDDLELFVASAHDPELDLMRQSYRDAFREAFTEALARLDPRDRDVLRCHLVLRMSIDEIGGKYDVHRATAARWLTAIRERLFEGTREALTARLAVDTAEYASILRLVRSQLDVSIAPALEE